MNALPAFITADPLFGKVPMNHIIVGAYQPRQTFNEEELIELAASYGKVGLLQPILLRPAKGKIDMYELVVGERRFRAAKIAGMTEIFALVHDFTDIQVATIQLIENIQRKDVNPLEEAIAIHRLRTEFALDVDAICIELSMKRAQVYARLKLLELPDATKDKVRDGTIKASTALLIARLPSDEEKTQATAKILEGDGTGSPMSVRAAMEYINTNHHQADDAASAVSTDTVAAKAPSQTQDKDATTSAAIADFNKTAAKVSKPKKLSQAELESIEKQRVAAVIAAQETRYYRSVYMAVRDNIATDTSSINESSRLLSIYGFLARASATREEGYCIIDVVAATYPFDFEDATAVAEFAATTSHRQIALLHLDSLMRDATEIPDWKIKDGFFALEEYNQKHALIALLDIASLYDVDVAALHATAFPPPAPEPDKEAPAPKTSKKSPAMPKAKATSKVSDEKKTEEQAATAKSKKASTVKAAADATPAAEVSNPAAAWPFPRGAA